MKKRRIITFLTICAAMIVSLCSIDFKSVSAEEVTEPATSQNLYGDNLFRDICYYWYSDNKYPYNEHICDYSRYEEVNYSNIMKFPDSESDIFVSMKFKFSGVFSQQHVNGIASGAGPFFILLDENFGNKVISSDYNNFVELSTYSVDIINEEEQEYMISYHMVFKNPKKFANYKNVEYFLLHPRIRLEVPNGSGYAYEYLEADNLLEMHVSFVENDSLSTALDVYNKDIDYTPNTSFNWIINDTLIDSNFITYTVNSGFDVSSLINVLNVRTNAGDKCTIDYSAINGEQLLEQGNTYEYIIHASDNSGNDDFIVLSLKVIDSEAPFIYGSNEYSVPSGSLLSINAIKNSFVVSDDVDSSEDIRITVKNDSYTKNYDKPGVYYVTFNATDTQGNSSEFVVKISVMDREAPNFYNSYNAVSKSCTVYKSLDSVLVMSDIISTLKAIDDVDGELEIKIHTDKYSGNGEVPGKYVVTLKANDNSGNVAYYTVNIIVSEDMPSKSILIDNKYIVVEKGNRLKQTDFHNVIKMIGTYNESTTSYTNINDTIYSTSASECGEYLVEYDIVTTSGVETNGVFIVKVVESRTHGSFTNEAKEEKKDGVIVSILKWIWNLILSFFEWIGSLFV